MADLLGTILPFLFVLAVVYGSLEVSDIFKKKQVKLIISFVFAYAAMTSELVSGFIISILPLATLLFVGFFFLGFALSFFKSGKKGERDYTMIMLVFALIAIFVASQGLEFMENLIPGVSRDDMYTGIGLVVILVILYSAYRLKSK